VIVAGTLTWEFVDARLTNQPPAGAVAARVTVPVIECPPVTKVGLKATLETFEFRTVSGMLLLTPS
jgi:hypothetical protein